MSSRLDLGRRFLFLRRHLHLLAISLLVIIIDFLLILGLLPIDFFILNGRLKISVDLRLFYFGLSLLDEQRQFIV